MADQTFLNPVIKKLVDLLVEPKLLKGLRSEVETLKHELQIIEPFLRDAEANWASEELNEASKVWMDQLREESERIVHVVDKYLYHMEQGRLQGGFLGSLRKAVRYVKDLNLHRQIASEIGDIKEASREIKKRGESFGLRPFEHDSSSSSETAVDPPIDSLLVDDDQLVGTDLDDELVGIESKSKELVIKLVEGSSALTVISIVGMGGIGKTTLARKVYNDVMAKEHFDYHVWITVSEYNRKKILKDMINEILPATEQLGGEIVSIEELIRTLRDTLTRERYMVVFDDVWDTKFWDFIKPALPDNVNGSRILVTTRMDLVARCFQETSHDIAQVIGTLSKENAWLLFCRKAFRGSEFMGCCPPHLEQLSCELLDKCRGLPLAIVTLGGILSRKEKSQKEWQKLLDNLEPEGNEFSDFLRILLLSYRDLPYHLKMCFLYFGIFPEDCSIFADRLYNLWIAEGFIESESGKSLEQVAEEYLNELIARSMVLHEEQFGFDKCYKVHDLFYDLIIFQIDECCFCHIFYENNLMFKGRKGRSRRLANHGNIKNALKVVRDSNIQSLFLFNTDRLTNSLLIGLFKEFKLLKVLDFRDAPLHELPKEVGILLHLKYLDLRGTKVTMLPKSIDKLRSLQTLNVSHTLVRELPMEINKLQNLRHLFASHYERSGVVDSSKGVRMKIGIGYLVNLQTLMSMEAHLSGMDVIQELKKLKQLRSLSISGLNAELSTTLCACIEELSHLESLSLYSTSKYVSLDIQDITSPPPSLSFLLMKGLLQRFPEWISHLQNLRILCLSLSRLADNPLEHLCLLPNLESLWLYQAYEGKKLHFKEGGFKKLKLLVLREMTELEEVEIEEAALSSIEELRIGPSPWLQEVPLGIQCLRRLKVFSLYDMPNKFVRDLQPDGGSDYGKIAHVPSVLFYYKAQERGYLSYTLGASNLLERLQGLYTNINEANQYDYRFSFSYSFNEDSSASTLVAQDDIPMLSFSNDRFSFFTDDLEE